MKKNNLAELGEHGTYINRIVNKLCPAYLREDAKQDLILRYYQLKRLNIPQDTKYLHVCLSNKLMSIIRRERRYQAEKKAPEITRALCGDIEGVNEG